MKKSVKSILAAAILCMLACTEREIVFETIEEDCDRECHIVSFVCDNAGDPLASKAACIEECLGWAEDSREQGAACAESYERMLMCVGKLETCDDISKWALRNPASPCTVDAQNFDNSCEDF